MPRAGLPKIAGRYSILQPHSRVALCAGSQGRGKSTDRLQDSIDHTGIRLLNRVVCTENATIICHDPPSYISTLLHRYSTRYQIRSSSRHYANRYYYTSRYALCFEVHIHIYHYDDGCCCTAVVLLYARRGRKPSTWYDSLPGIHRVCVVMLYIPCVL